MTDYEPPMEHSGMDSDAPDSVHVLRWERARLRIAYMALYREYLKLHDYCLEIGKEPDANQT